MSTPPPGFQWDPDKEQRNIKKRGLDFGEASRIFDGPTITTLDDRFDYGEDRLNAIGYVNGRPLNVTFTERDGEYRIISARSADRGERQDLQQMMLELSKEPSPSPTPDPKQEGLGDSAPKPNLFRRPTRDNPAPPGRRRGMDDDFLP